MGLDWSALALPLLRALVILVPSYSVAYLTGEMVYTIPTLAASASIAAGLKTRDRSQQQRVDDDGDGGEAGDGDAESSESGEGE